MLLIPMTEYVANSLVLACIDAGVLAVVVSPIVFFLIRLDPVRLLSFSNTDKLRHLRRQFLWLLLPQLLLFFLATEAIYFQEARSMEKYSENENIRLLELIRSDLSREMNDILEELLLLARNSLLLPLNNRDPERHKELIRHLSGLLQIKSFFKTIYIVDDKGKVNLEVDLLADGTVQERRESTIDFAKESTDLLNSTRGEIKMDWLKDGAVVRIGTPIFDQQGNIGGVIFLDCFWSNFETLIRNLAATMSGHLYFYFDNKVNFYSFPLSDKEFSINRDLWDTINNSPKGRLLGQEGVILFTTFSPLSKILKDRVGPTWKILSWIPLDRQDSRLVLFRERLLIFQTLLIGLALLGSWFFSRSIINRREAEIRNERAYQSRITLSALLETTLEPMSMEKQLRTAIQIISTTPWLGLTGKGAVFIADPAIKQMKLVAHDQLNVQEQQQVAKVSMTRCLCQRENNWRGAIQLPQDDPEHIPCLKSNTGQSNYCIPIPGSQGPVGVMHMQLKSGSISRDDEAFFSTVAGTLSGIIERRRMESELQIKNEELKKTRLDIIHRLGMAAEFRDMDTGFHIVRMSKYAAILAQAAGFPEEFCEILLNAAPMHDVGKIGIPDHILLKPGRLNEEEWEIMKKHTLIGSMMLHGYEAEPMNTAHIIALTHHERWDGKGYPIGAPGEEIPIEGRICAIADVFDALISTRPYKNAWSVEDALMEIRKGAGTSFDPHLVTAFVDCFPEIVAVSKNYIDE
ncbi:MAG: HD domain-containing protein [Magnetococcales bacterium]|nr:HD domain-containing protein [Magnetococcales bacterium]